MTEYKAKKTGLVFRDKYFTQVEYEYRGRKYEVEFSNSWTCCTTPAYIQHRDRQAEIDKAIDNPVPAKEQNIDWDEIFSMLEG